MFDVAFTLGMQQQNDLVALCREVIRQAPLFQKTMPNGSTFNYLCTSAGDFGWLSDRKGYRYEKTHPTTKQAFPPMPDLIHEIAVRAAEACGEPLVPQSALINWYTADSKLGLHVDKTENCDSPVISISLGADCVFVKGGKKRADAKETIILHSGDVFVMSGEHRYYHHGVKKILLDTMPADLDMRDFGRLNITVRQVNPV
ncbi:MAG: alpha-ketoglutarate-dependent dioxygenase AlkB [Chloroflexota bacterium]